MGKVKVQQVPLIFKKIDTIKKAVQPASLVLHSPVKEYIGEALRTPEEVNPPIQPEIPAGSAFIEEINEDEDIESTFKEVEARLAQRDELSEFLNRQFVFITGPAGSGKTFTINQKNMENRDYIELGATTGIAAINLDVKTINSLLKYYDTDSLLDNYIDKKLHWRLREIREEKQVLGIEEVSMMPARQLDIIFDAINEINDDANPKKLGLHIIGDLLQLPPVSTKLKPEDIIVKAKCWPFFQQNTYKLTKIWRQSANNFIGAINAVRSGEGAKAVKMLKECGVQFIPNLIDRFDGTTLITKNELVDDYNAKRLAEVNAPIINSIPKRLGEQLGEWKQIPQVMRFKIGAYVMILSNDTPNFTYVNGDCGEIVDCKGEGDKQEFGIRLKRTNEVVWIPRIIRKNLSKKQPDQRHFSSSFTPYVDTFTKRWVIGDIHYHPLRLAWATTVHKSQGLSLDRVQIDATQAFFGFPGMAYVAISRARTPENLFIVGNDINLERKIKTNRDVMNYV